MADSRNESTTISKTRWAAYAAAGAACAVGTQQAAEAAITVFDVNVAVEDTDPAGAGVGFFLSAPGGTGTGTTYSTNGVVPAHQLLTDGVRGAAFVVPLGNAAIAGFVTSGFTYASNLAYGAVVSAAPNGFIGQATLAFGAGYTSSQFTAPGIGYIGFSFDAGAGTQYGWVEVDMNGVPLNDFTILRYAFGDIGDQVQAGVGAPIPEPASAGALGLLAFGATGLSRWRKARNVA